MQASEVLFVMLLCGMPIIAAALGFIVFRQRKEIETLKQQLQERDGQYVEIADNQPYLPHEVALVGESHYQDNLRKICGKSTRDGEEKAIKVRLQPEPDNPYDNLAIRAQINGQTVGYLNKVDARRYAQRVGTGIDVLGTIRGGWDRGGDDRGHYGVSVNL